MSNGGSASANDGTVSKPNDCPDDGFPSEELRRIYSMASPPYAFLTPNYDDGEQERDWLYHYVMDHEGPPWDVAWIWGKLTDEVEALAASIHEFLRPWNMLPPEVQDSLVQLGGEKNTELFYNCYHLSAYLIQAWLWRILDDHLFSSPDKWATPTWKMFGDLSSFFASRRTGTLRSRLSADVTVHISMEARRAEYEYHHWRTFTLRMLQRNLGPRAKHKHSSFERLTKLIMPKLADLMDTTEAKVPPGHFEQRVNELTDMAVLVDWCRLCERRHFMIAWHLPAMSNAASMRGYSHRESPALRTTAGIWWGEGEPIDFVVRPGLFMSGRREGTRFDQGEWAMPILVIINQFPNGVPEDQPEDFVPGEPKVASGIKRYRRNSSGRLVSY